MSATSMVQKLTLMIEEIETNSNSQNIDPTKRVKPAELNDLPKEILNNIFCYLSWREAHSKRIICHKWKKIVDDIEFPYQYFPKFQTHPYFNTWDYSGRLTEEQFAMIIQRYVSQMKERKKDDTPVQIKLKLELFKCTNQLFEKLSALNCKIRHLSIRLNIGDDTCAKGLVKLIESNGFMDQGKLKLGFQENCFTDEVLDELIKKKVSLTYLSFGKGITKNKFIEFIQNKGLESPCALEVCTDKLIDSEIIEALIQAQVKFKVFKVNGDYSITSATLIPLIKAGSLLPGCHLNFSACFKIDETILIALTEAKVQVSSIFFEKLESTETELHQYIKQVGFFSPCQISLPKRPARLSIFHPSVAKGPTNSTAELVQEFVKKGAPVIESFRGYLKPTELQTLITEGKWSSPCYLDLSEIREEINDSILESIIQAKLSIFCLDLSGCKQLSAAKFCEFLNAGCLRLPVLNLQGCSWVNSSVIQALAASKTKFKYLNLPTKIKERKIKDQSRALSESILTLTKSEILDNSYFSVNQLIPPEILDVVLGNLSSTNVRALSFSKVIYDSKSFLNLFANSKAFFNLGGITVEDCAWFTDSLAEALQALRPQIHLYVSSSKTVVYE